MSGPAGKNVAVQVRLPESLVKAIDHLRVDLGLRRNGLVAELLREALDARAAAERAAGGGE